MIVPLNSGASGPASGRAPQSPADWSKLGLDGDPLPGDPRVLQGIIDDFTYLRDVAWSVSQGLDAFVASASSGGFEGATADALREVVSGRLKTFVFNVARSFSLAGEAVAEYRLALAGAQQAVRQAFEATNGLVAGDPKLAGLRQRVADQQSVVADAAAALESELRDAASMVSQPIKVPGLFERIWKGLEKALDVTAMVLALLSVFVDGPLGMLAFGAGAAAFGITAVDVARGQAGWKQLLLSSLGLLAPEVRGLFSLGSVGAGVRALVGGLGRAGGRAVDVLSSPGEFGEFVARGVLAAGQGLSRAGQAVGRAGGVLPGLLWRGVGLVPGLVVRVPRGLGWVWESASGVVGRDFERVVARYPRLVAGVEAHAAYGLVSLGRVAGALFTPMTFGEMAVLGFRGAWAAMRERASLARAVRDLRAGWAGYRGIGAVAGEGLELGWHGLGEHGGYLAGGAGLREPEPAAVLGGGMSAGAKWRVMEKLPWQEFEQLMVEAGGILQPLMRQPLVVGRDTTKEVLGSPRYAPLVEVAYVLRTRGRVAAEVRAGVIAGDRMRPPLPGLPGGARDHAGPSGTSGLWAPDTARGVRTPGVDEGGVAAAEGQRSSLVSALPGSQSLTEQYLERAARMGHIPTHAGVLAPVTGVFSDEAVQTLERLVAGQASPTHELPAGTPVSAAGLRERLGRLDGVIHARTDPAPTPPPDDLRVSRHLSLINAANDLAGVRVTVINSRAVTGAEVPSYALRGSSAKVAMFDIAPVTEGASEAGRHAFVITDGAAGHRYHFDADGRQLARDMWVGDEGQTTGLGYLRYDTGPSHDLLPRLVDELGRPLEKLRVARLDSRRLMLLPTKAGRGAPLERLVVDARDGRLLSGIFAKRSRKGLFSRGGSYGTGYWSVDYERGRLAELDASGAERRVWSTPPFLWGDGYVAVLDPATGGMGGDLFRRPALGAVPGGEGPAWETVPPWLTGRGTGTRLPFERHSAFAWGMVSGGWDEHSEPELLWVRVRASRAGRGLTLTNMAGDTLGIRAEFARDAEGLTVRAAVSDEPGARWAEYRFDLAGRLVRQEWPVRVNAARVPPGSLRAVMRPDASRADVGAWTYELAGPPEAVRGFRVDRVPGSLRGDRRFRRDLLMNRHVGDVFTVLETGTGIRTYYSSLVPGRELPLWDLPLDRTGMRVLVRPGGPAMVVDEASRRLRAWRATDLGGGRVLVLRVRNPDRAGEPDAQIVPGVPMLLHVDGLRVDWASDFVRDEHGLRAGFAAHGAPDGVMASFRHNRLLTRENLPLLGGGRGEEGLRSLRFVVERDWGDPRAAGGTVQRQVVRRELRGEDAALFVVGELAEPEAGRAPELVDGFTVTEGATGILRHYDASAALAFRDLPLDRPGQPRAYLRVGVGGRAGELRVVGEGGAPLDGWEAVRLGENRVAVGATGGQAPRWILLDPETGRPVRDSTHAALGDGLPLVFRRMGGARGASVGEPDGAASGHVAAPPSTPEAGSEAGNEAGRLEQVQAWWIDRVEMPHVDVPALAEESTRQLEASGFGLSPREDGGYDAVHLESGLRMVYDAQARWVSREAAVARDAGGRVSLRAVISRSLAGDGTEVSRSYRLEGDSGLVTQYDIAAGTAEGSSDAGHDFVLTDLTTGHRYHYDSDGARVMRDLWVGDEGQTTGLGYLRFRGGESDDVPPTLVDAHGRPLDGWRVDGLHTAGATVRLVPGGSSRSGEFLRVDRLTGRVTREGIAVRDEAGEIHAIQMFDHQTWRAWRVGAQAEPAHSLAEYQSDGAVLTLVRDGGSARRQVLFTRPALGSDPRHWPQALRESAPRWLAGTGTARRLTLNPAGVLSTRERFRLWVVLPDGRQRAAQISVSERGLEVRSHGGGSQVRADNEAVGIPAEFARDADTLTVRVPTPYVPDGSGAEFRYDWDGAMAGAQWPMADDGDPGLGSLRVVMTRGEGPAGQGWRYELVGPSEAAGRFGIAPVTEEFLHSAMGQSFFPFANVNDHFVVTEHDTGIRRYYCRLAAHTPDVRVERLDDVPGLRLALGATGLIPWARAEFYDDGDALVRSAQLRNGWTAVGRREGEPLLVHHASRRVAWPTRFARDAQGVRAGFAVPEATGRDVVEFRFDQNGDLVRGETLAEPVSGTRGYYGEGAALVYRDVPLDGLRYLRVHVDGQEHPQVVDESGNAPEQERPIVSARDTDGGLIVRVPMTYAFSHPWRDTAEFRFDQEANLVRQEWPLAGDGHLAALGALRVVMDRGAAGPYVPGWTYYLLVPDGAQVREVWPFVAHPEPGVLPPDPPQWTWEWAEPSGEVRRFRVDLPPGDFQEQDFARALGSDQVLAVTDTDTGESAHYRFDGTLLAREVPVEGAPGLRIVYHREASPPVDEFHINDFSDEIYDEFGNAMLTADLPDSRRVVLREHDAPLLVRVAGWGEPLGARVETPARFSSDAEGWTVRIQAPGAPDGVTAAYRLTWNGWLAREDLPLTGLGAADVHLGALRIVTTRARTTRGLVVAHEFHGKGTELFQLHELVPSNEGLPSDLAGGTTLTERGNGILRHLGPRGDLAYRDLPLLLSSSEAEAEARLRLGAGLREGEVRVVGAGGVPLAGWRAEPVRDGQEPIAGDRVTVVPTLWDYLPEQERPLIRMVIGTGSARPVEETLSIHGELGTITGYWRIDYVAGRAALLDVHGREVEDWGVGDLRAAVSPDLRTRLVAHGGHVVFDRSRWELPPRLRGTRPSRAAAQERLLEDARWAVEEFRQAAEGAPGTVPVIGGFAITAKDGRYITVHAESRQRMVFDEWGRWISRDIPLAETEVPLAVPRVTEDRTWTEGGAELRSYRLTGSSAQVAPFTVTPAVEQGPRLSDLAFIVTDPAGHRYHFGAEGTQVVRDTWVGDQGRTVGIGYLRFDRRQPEGTPPSLVDAAGRTLGWNVTPVEEGRFLVLRPPPSAFDQPLGEQLRVDAASGALVEEVIALRNSEGQLQDRFLWYSHARGWARTLSADFIPVDDWQQVLRREAENGFLELVRVDDGQVVFGRPALGHRPQGGPVLPPRAVPGWLTRQGTVRRLPFDAPDRFRLGVARPGGSTRQVRISAGPDGLRLLDAEQRAVDAGAGFTRDAEGLTVRLPAPYAREGSMAEFRFDAEGVPVRVEWPLAGRGDWRVLDGLSVVMTLVPAPAGPRWAYALVGSSRMRGRFEIGPPTEAFRTRYLAGTALAGDQRPHLFMFAIAEQTTGNRRYYFTADPVEPVAWEMPLATQTAGGPRLLAGRGLAPEVHGPDGGPASGWTARETPEGWVVVLPPEDGAPLLVHPDRLRPHTATGHTRDADGVTARFRMPGIPRALRAGGTPDEVASEYRISNDGRVIRMDLPLTGLGAREAHLGALHAVGATGRDESRLGLRGPGAERFRIERLADGADASLARELPGGFTLTEAETGIRYHFTSGGRLAYRDVPLTRSRYLRLAARPAAGGERAAWVVGTRGRPVRGGGSAPGIDIAHDAEGLTVRVPVGYAPPHAAELRFDEEGVPVRQEWPLAGTDMRVVIARGTDPADPAWHYEPAGPPEADPLPIELPTWEFRGSDLFRDLGGGRMYAVTGDEHGFRDYYAFNGTGLAWERPVDGAPGLRFIYPLHPDSALRVYDASGHRVATTPLVDSRLAVIRSRPDAPLLVNPYLLRAAAPVGFSWEAGEVTARFAVPGAPEWATAEYRFAEDGRPVEDALPLIGGGAAEARLGSLRVVFRHDFEQADPLRVPVEVRGEGAHLFRVEPLATVDARLAPELPGGFTLTESGTPGVRRHYAADADLVYRDLSLEQMGVAGYLRVPVGDPRQAPHVVDVRGLPLRGWRTQPHGGDRLALVHAAWERLPEDVRPSTRVIDTGTGQLETLRATQAGEPGPYRRLDHGTEPPEGPAPQRRADPMEVPAPMAVTYVVDPEHLGATGRVEVLRTGEDESAQVFEDARDHFANEEHTQEAGHAEGGQDEEVFENALDHPEVPDVVEAERLIANGRAQESAAGRDPAALLPQARAVRAAAQERLLADARRAAEAGRAVPGFAVVALHGGGQRVVHTASGLRTVFDGRGEWVRRDIPLTDTADGLDGLTVVVTRIREDGREDRSYRLAGAVPSHLGIAPVVESTSDAGHAFVITDAETGHRSYFGAEGTQVARDVWVGDEGQTTGLGYLRFEGGMSRTALPLLLDESGRPLRKLRVARRLDDRRLELVPTEAGRGPARERLVVDAHDGRPLEETIAVRSRLGGWFDRGGSPGQRYWRVDRVGRIVEEFDVRDGRVAVWYHPPFRSGEGYVTVLNPANGGMTDLFNRPALGAEPGPGYALETLPPWLTGRGTGTRLPLGRPGDTWRPLPENEVEPAADAHGMTLRLRLSEEPGARRALFRFDTDGELARQEWPVPASDQWTPPDSLRVVLRRTGGDTDRPVFTPRLAGPQDVVRRFRAGRVPAYLAEDERAWEVLFMGLPRDDLFTITELDSGVRTYYSAGSYERGLPLLDLPLPGTEMRVLGRPGEFIVINEVGRRSRGWPAADLGDGRVVVLRDFSFPATGDDGRIAPAVPMLLHTDSARLAMATDFTREADGMTAWFAVPGAPEGVTARYRFDATGTLLRADQPLTGGGAAEERLGGMRIAVEYEWREGRQAGNGLGPQRRVTRRELRGADAGLFRVEEPAEAEFAGARELRGGFTLIERATGIRRQYGPGAAMVYRDWPLWTAAGVPSVPRGGYLRVGVGDRADELRVVGADGAPLGGWRVEPRADGLVAVVPADRRLLTRFVLNPEHGRTREILPVPSGDGAGYWKIDYEAGRAVRLDSAGRPFDPELPAATVEMSQDTTLLVREGQVVFERSRWRMAAEEAEEHGLALQAGDEPRTPPVPGDRLLDAARRALDERTEGFAVTALDGGGHAVVDIESGARTVFDARREWVSREIPLAAAAERLAGLRAVMTRSAEGPPYRLAGASHVVEVFDIMPEIEGTPRAGQAFVVTDMETGHRYHLNAAGDLVTLDLWVGDEGQATGLGYLRYDSGRPHPRTLPRLVDELGRPLEKLRVADGYAGPGRLTLVPTEAGGGAPLEELVVDADTGRLLSEVIAGRSHAVLFFRGGWSWGRYWSVDHVNGSVRLFLAPDSDLRRWQNRTIHLADGSVRVDLPRGGGTALYPASYTRPALGAEPGDERYIGAGRSFRWESVPPWLTGRGTRARLPFGRPDAFVLHGLGRGLRVAPVGNGLALVNAAGQVAGRARFARDAESLTAWIPVFNRGEEAPAEFRFDGNGTLVRRVLPLDLGDAAVPYGSLRLVMHLDGSRALAGPDDVLDRFQLDALPLRMRERRFAVGVLRTRDPVDSLFTITDRFTGVRTHFSSLRPGTSLPIGDLPLYRPGLRFLVRDGFGWVTDEVGGPVSWTSTHLDGDLHTVQRNLTAPGRQASDGQIVPDLPLLVRGDTRRVDVATGYTRDAHGMTAEFAWPGAPEGIRAEYRYTRNGRLLRREEPLTGGGSAEEPLRSLRLAVEFDLDPYRVTLRQLRGPGSSRFRVEPLSAAEEERTPALWAGFTVTELGTGIRRTYGPARTLAFRDLLLWEDHYLRVGVGEQPDELWVVGADGAPLGGWRVELRADGLADAAPAEGGLLTRFTLNPQDGRRAAEILPVRTEDGFGYWSIDYDTRRAVRLDAAGAARPDQPETALVGQPADPLLVRAGQVVLDRARWRMPQRLNNLRIWMTERVEAPEPDVPAPAERSEHERAEHERAEHERAEHERAEPGIALPPPAEGGQVALHGETGPRAVYDEQGQLISRELPVFRAVAGRGALHVVMSPSPAQDGAFSYRPAGDGAMLARYHVEAAAEGTSGAGHLFVLTDMATGNRYHFPGGRAPAVRDLWVGAEGETTGLGYLRYDSGAPPGTPPALVDADGRPLGTLRVEAYDEGELALVPAAGPGEPPELAVADARDGRLLHVRDARDGRLLHTFTPRRPRKPLSPVAARWLTGRGTGTVPRLGFGSPDAFVLGHLPGLGASRVRVIANEHGLALSGWGGLVDDGRVEFARDAEGLTVRVPMPGAPDAGMAEYRFHMDGTLVLTEWPLPNHGVWAGLGSLRVIRRPDPDGQVVEGMPEQWLYEMAGPSAESAGPSGLAGPSRPVGRFRIEPLGRFRTEPLGDGVLLTDLGRHLWGQLADGFALRDLATDLRRYHADTGSGTGALQIWDVQRVGVRVVRVPADEPELELGVYDLAGGALPEWQARYERGGAVVVAQGPDRRDGMRTEVLLVRTDTLSAQAAIGVTREEYGLTATFIVSGAPRGPRAVYRFNSDRRLVRAELPLTGGGDAEQRLASLRLVEVYGDEVTRELRGGGAAAFHLHGTDDEQAGLPGEQLPHGFTVTEPETRIRRHYRGDAGLALRDLPLGLPGEEDGYLRVGVGERPDELWVVGAGGAPLAGWRAVWRGGDRVAVVPEGEGQPAWIVLSPETGRRVESDGDDALGGVPPVVVRRGDSGGSTGGGGGGERGPEGPQPSRPPATASSQ